MFCGHDIAASCPSAWEIERKACEFVSTVSFLLIIRGIGKMSCKVAGDAASAPLWFCLTVKKQSLIV